MYYYYGFDWSYWVVMGVSFIITLIAQIWVSSAMSKYSKVMSKSGLTGHEAALTILRDQGIMGVSVTPIQGNYSDHYNPRNKNVSLSQPVFNNRSITAISVAAHECGHAVQDATNYGFLSFRTALVTYCEFLINNLMVLYCHRIVLSEQCRKWNIPSDRYNLIFYCGIIPACNITC